VSAALVKATIINSAERLTGLVKLGQSHSGAEYRSSPRGAGYFWNMSNSQVNGNKFSGFGLPRLARVLKGTQSFGTQNMFVDDNDSGVRTGDTVEYTVFNVDPTKELRVTLAWTDFPAPPGLERVLINDLDLVTTVTSGSAALPTNTQVPSPPVIACVSSTQRDVPASRHASDIVAAVSQLSQRSRQGSVPTLSKTKFG